ncbi:MAG: hypothetical protein ACI87W_002818 [Halieaceae bacterium]|jgi:hypothetical protein
MRCLKIDNTVKTAAGVLWQRRGNSVTDNIYHAANGAP